MSVDVEDLAKQFVIRKGIMRDREVVELFAEFGEMVRAECADLAVEPLQGPKYSTLKTMVVKALQPR